MNRAWVLQNLRETVEHIESVIAAVENGDEHSFEVWIEFIYRDLNRAWNGRESSSLGTEIPDDLLRAFPTDITFED